MNPEESRLFVKREMERYFDAPVESVEGLIAGTSWALRCEVEGRFVAMVCFGSRVIGKVFGNGSDGEFSMSAGNLQGTPWAFELTKLF